MSRLATALLPRPVVGTGREKLSSVFNKRCPGSTPPPHHKNRSPVGIVSSNAEHCLQSVRLNVRHRCLTVTISRMDAQRAAHPTLGVAAYDPYQPLPKAPVPMRGQEAARIDMEQVQRKLTEMTVHGIAPAAQSAHEEGVRRVNEELKRRSAEDAVAATTRLLVCSVSQAMMRDAVQATDGHTYTHTSLTPSTLIAPYVRLLTLKLGGGSGRGAVHRAKAAVFWVVEEARGVKAGLVYLGARWSRPVANSPKGRRIEKVSGRYRSRRKWIMDGSTMPRDRIP